MAAALDVHDPSMWVSPPPALVGALVELSGVGRDDFAARLGVDASTLRRWTMPIDQTSHRPVPYGAWCLALVLAGYARVESLAFPVWRAPTGDPPPIANRAGQLLVEHGALVARLAGHIISDSYGQPHPGTHTDPDRTARWRDIAFAAGALHDIGKLDPDFQRYLRTVRAGVERDDADDGTHIDNDHAEGRFGADQYPRHEEVSWLLSGQLLDPETLQRDALGGGNTNVPFASSRLGMLRYAIRWHHARPLRRPEDQKRFDNSDEIERGLQQRSDWLEDGAHEALERYLVDLDRLTGKALTGAVQSRPLSRPAEGIPPFKELYSSTYGLEPPERLRSINTEAARSAIRSALVTADRVVSALRPSELSKHLERDTLPSYVPEAQHLSKLHEQIAAMLARFESDARSARQSEAAHALAALTREGRAACLDGPAGCGKTKIALEWLALEKPRRTIVLVPRTAIGEALFDELVDEYGLTANVEYLSGAVRRFRSAGDTVTVDTPEELEGTGDVLITTIDQLCGTLLSHRRIDLVTHLAHSHVIFDEVHELFDLPGIVVLFLEIMRLRQGCNGATLLISATPNRHFLKHLDIADQDVVRMATFNTRPYRLRWRALTADAYAGGGIGNAEPGLHPFLDGTLEAAPGTFIVCNTATLAQQSAVVHRRAGHDVLCLHGRFTPKDKSTLIGRALTVCGRETEVERANGRPLLVAGPIVQASLNLSTGHLHTEACTGEHFLQRIGRVNRFAELDEAIVELHVSRRTNGRLGNARFLHALNQDARAEAFTQALEPRIRAAASSDDECTIDLPELYRWYDDFQATPEAEEAYAVDFDGVMKASKTLFEELTFDPVQYPGSRTKNLGTLSTRSLRGRSCYVLPLVADVRTAEQRAVLSLLWTDKSAVDERLTDELRETHYEDELATFFLKLTRAAGKPAYLSPTLVGGDAKRFLAALGRASHPIRTWRHLRARARRPDAPIMLARERFDENNRYYMHYDGVALGLMRPDRFDAVAAPQTLAVLIGGARRARR